MEKQKIAVFFPGNFYPAKAPLFYYADLVLARKGFRVIELSYDHISENEEDWIQTAREQFLEQLRSEGIENAGEIVFVSKSIGTVIAGWISAQLEAESLPRVKNVFFSPLKGSLPFLASEDCIVYAGTKDRLLDAGELKDFCEENRVRFKIFEGAGHAIVDRSDPEKSVRILGEMVKGMEEYF